MLRFSKNKTARLTRVVLQYLPEYHTTQLFRSLHGGRSQRTAPARLVCSSILLPSRRPGLIHLLARRLGVGREFLIRHSDRGPALFNIVLRPSRSPSGRARAVSRGHRGRVGAHRGRQTLGQSIRRGTETNRIGSGRGGGRCSRPNRTGHLGHRRRDYGSHRDQK